MERKAVKIFTAQTSIQAEMIMIAFKENGIPSYKEDLGNAGILSIYGRFTKDGEDTSSRFDCGKAKEILEGMGFGVSPWSICL